MYTSDSVLLASLTEAVGARDWARVLEIGEKLVSNGLAPHEAPDVHLQVCIAVEHLGWWTKLAHYAERGIEACEVAGVRDGRLVLFLWALGRGNMVLGRYQDAAMAYGRAMELAQELGDDAAYWASRRSRAVCLERMGGPHRAKAESEYRTVLSQATSGRVRMAAAANLAWLLYGRGDIDGAYDVAVMSALTLPHEDKTGAAWAGLLRILAFLEVLRGRPDLSIPMIEDAFKVIPDQSFALRATLVGIQAIAIHRMGRPEEALMLLDEAWRLIEYEPDLTAREFLFTIESMLEGGE